MIIILSLTVSICPLIGKISLVLFYNYSLSPPLVSTGGEHRQCSYELLSPQAKVKCDGNWKEIKPETADFVPDDIISSKIGGIVPADCCIVVRFAILAFASKFTYPPLT